MAADVKVRILRSVCIGAGRTAQAGEVLTLPAETVAVLVLDCLHTAELLDEADRARVVAARIAENQRIARLVASPVRYADPDRLIPR
jgi:hypothetical protein